MDSIGTQILNDKRSNKKVKDDQNRDKVPVRM